MAGGANGIGRGAVIVISLLGAGFFAAYLRFLPYLQQHTAYTDGEHRVDLGDVDQLRFALWAEAEALSGAVNTPDEEGRPSVSPDGRLLVFAVGERGLNADLWVADLVDGEAGAPRPLARLNTTADELAPAFDAEGLVFASNRSGGAGGLDLWRADYRDGSFGPARWMGEELNTSHDETDPAPLPAGRGLAFATDRPRGRRTDFDLVLALPPGVSASGLPLADAPVATSTGTEDPVGSDEGREETAPESDGPASTWELHPFADLNTPFDEREPAFAADGLALVFASDREGGSGGFDLYRSVASAGAFARAEAMTGLNTAASERGPHPSRDGFTLLFSRQTPGRSGDLMRARSVELFRLDERPVGWWDLAIVALLLLLALLAWLGKRWEALDILYKCLLVSVLAHLGMMLWFREVPVESEIVELPESTPALRVRLAPSNETLAANAERAGQLEVARSGAGDFAAPERAALPTPEQGLESPALAEALELRAPALETRTAPDRSADAPNPDPDREAATRVAQAELRDAPEPGELLAGAAPEMSLEASDQVSAEASRRAASSTRAPDRAQRVLAAGAASPTEAVAGPRPATPSLTLPTVGHGPALPGPTARATPAPRASDAPAVTVSGPATAPPEATEVVAAGAPATLRLDDLGEATSKTTSTRSGPARPDRSPTATGLTRPGSAGATPAPQTLALAAPLLSGAPQAVLDATATRSATSPGPLTRKGPRIPTRQPLGATPEAATGRPGTPGPESTRSGSPSTLDTDDLGQLAVAPVTRQSTAVPVRPGRLSASTPAPVDLDRPVPTFTPLVAAAPAPVESVLPPRRKLDDTPYRTRFGEAKVAALEELGGNEETEKAVAAGLAYLAGIQARDGYWGDKDDYDDKYGHVAVGKTALCLLAFLGAGHTPDAGSEHAAVASRAVRFLLGVQDEATGHFGYNTSYSHAVTTYALAECYALTKDARLLRPIQRGVTWILKQQNGNRDPRRFGGWGYYYPDGRTYDPWPRSSITAWQVMALESARLGGLAVPDQAFDDALEFLDYAHKRDRSVVLYSQDPDRVGSRYWTLPGSTPAGLFALALLGEDITSREYAGTIAFVLDKSPRRYREASVDRFVSHAEGNLYFWYYGSLAMLRHGGEAWEAWNEALQSTLLPAQAPDGSWMPISTYADYAGDDRRDKSYTTAMCVLTLEIYYRYFTPLLKVK